MEPIFRSKTRVILFAAAGVILLLLLMLHGKPTVQDRAGWTLGRHRVEFVNAVTELDDIAVPSGCSASTIEIYYVSGGAPEALFVYDSRTNVQFEVDVTGSALVGIFKKYSIQTIYAASGEGGYSAAIILYDSDEEQAGISYSSGGGALFALNGALYSPEGLAAADTGVLSGTKDGIAYTVRSLGDGWFSFDCKEG